MRVIAHFLAVYIASTETGLRNLGWDSWIEFIFELAESSDPTTNRPAGGSTPFRGGSTLERCPSQTAFQIWWAF